MNQTRQQRRAEERRAKKRQGIVHIERLTRAEALARAEPVCPCCPEAGVTIITETCEVDEDCDELPLAERLADIRSQAAEMPLEEVLAMLELRDELIVRDQEFITSLHELIDIDAEIRANQDDIITKQDAIISKLQDAIDRLGGRT